MKATEIGQPLGLGSTEELGPRATLVERLRAGTGGGKHWMDLHTEAADEIERLQAALTWALGANGDFRQRGTMDGAFWWRGELAERAGLKWDGAQYVPSGPNVLLNGAP